MLGAEYRRGIERTLELLAGGKPSGAARAALIRKMSTLLGAVILARAVGNCALRDEIIATARQSA